MNGDELTPEALELTRYDCLCCEQLVQLSRTVELQHLYCMFDDLTNSTDPRSTIRGRNSANIEV